MRPERRSAVHADPARIRPRPSWRFLGISIRQQVTFGSRAEKEFFFPMTEAGMCMKTNKTAIICRPKMTTFLRDLAECSDFSYRPSRILRESRPFLSRIERRRTQSCFQSAESQAPGFTGRANVADAYSSPPPALVRRPSLAKEGSFCCESGGESLGRVGGGALACGKCRWRPRYL